MTTLDDLVQDATVAALNSDSLRDRVRKAADEAIDSCIKSAFGYSSDFRRLVEKKLREITPILNEDDFVTFSMAMRDAVSQRLSGVASVQAATIASELVDKLMEPRQVTVSELKDEFKEHCEEELAKDDLCHCEEVEVDGFLWNIEVGKSNDRYWDIVCSKDEDASHYGADTTRIRFRSSDVDPDVSECWHVSTYGKGLPPFSSAPIRGWELTIWQIATGIVKVATP